MRVRFITGSLIVLLVAGAVGAVVVWRSRADRSEAVAVEEKAEKTDDEGTTTRDRPRRLQAVPSLGDHDLERLGSKEPANGAEEAATLSPRESRERQIQKVVQSGPDRRGMITSAAQVRTAWAAEAKKERLDVRVGEVRCYAGGCLIAVEHGSELLVDRMTEQVSQSAMFHRWNAGKMRTGPVALASGKIDATWVLFPPGDGEPTLQAGEFAGPGQPPTASSERAATGL